MFTSIVIIDCASKTHRLANISECFKVHLVSLESWNSSWFGWVLFGSKWTKLHFTLYEPYTEKEKNLWTCSFFLKIFISFYPGPCVLFHSLLFFFLGYVNKREQLFSSLFVHVKYCMRWHVEFLVSWGQMSQLCLSQLLAWPQHPRWWVGVSERALTLCKHCSAVLKTPSCYHCSGHRTPLFHTANRKVLTLRDWE